MNIIRMSGGLGNQMFQYAFCMKLQAMGKEVKFDDINEYRGENTRPIMLAVFGVTYPRATWDEITEFTDGSMQPLKRIRRHLFGRRAVEYKEEGFYDPRTLEFDHMYLRGAFQSEKYFEDIKEQVRNTYRFPALEDMHLPEKLYRSTRRCLDSIENSNGCGGAVGIHMYRSDSRDNYESYEGICTEKYYEGAVRYMQDKCPEAKFYIFSNEPKWVKNWVRALVKSQISEEMNEEESSRQHQRFVLVEANTEHTGYLDMLLMSRCSHNIISNSSFSWWAAWLNDHPQKQIVAPDKWVNECEGGDIYTKGMTLVNAKGRVVRTVKE